MSGGMEECARLEKIRHQKVQEATASNLHYKQEEIEKRIGRMVLAMLELANIHKNLK